jgi:poly(hydroxyalkanoate) depolymerase family esterase
MAEALRLTRAGRLGQATALIQRILGGASASALEPDGRAAMDKTAESTYRVLSVDPVLARLPAAAPTERTRSDTPEGAQGHAEAVQEVQESPRHGPRIRLGVSGPRPGRAEPAPAMPVLNQVLNRAFPNILPEAGVPILHPLPGLASVPSVPATTVPEIEPGGRFLTGTYTAPAGTRGYKLYVASGYVGQAAPLVVMLHGCGQTADDSAAGTRLNWLAEQVSWLVVYPEQAASANPSRCWNWFQAAHQRRGEGEPSLIAGITQQVMATYGVDPRRVYVAGMSAGGAMAAIMGAAYPDLYAAVGVHSGLASGAAQDLRSAFAAMRRGKPTAAADTGAGPRLDLALIVFHGDRDATVHPRNSEHVLAQAVRRSASEPDRRVTVSHGQVPGGHAYTRTLYHDATAQVVGEHWLVHGAGHAWSGGSPAGSFTDPQGPAAAMEMLRFFREHPKRTTPL